jgi:cell division protein FtsA
VAIVDIGGGTTDLAIFHEGMLKHTVVIPIAGVNITNDIRQGLGVLKSQAEQMKVQFGMALADEAKPNAFITIPGLKGQQPKEISAKNLAHIIQSRMDEILEYVVYHIKQQNLQDKLHGGIILTGGGSQLKHLMQLTQFRTGLNARIGLPNEHLAAGHTTELLKPMYATCIGLILRGYDDFENNRLRFTSNNTEDNLPESVEAVGTFTSMTQKFEPSVEELLQQEFGQAEDNHSLSNLYPSAEHTLTLDTVQEIQTNLFQAPNPNQPIAITDHHGTKINERSKVIKDVFSTVKTTVLHWFENVDDERLDN